MIHPLMTVTRVLDGNKSGTLSTPDIRPKGQSDCPLTDDYLTDYVSACPNP
jgi:hypothetical protein